MPAPFGLRTAPLTHLPHHQQLPQLLQPQQRCVDHHERVPPVLHGATHSSHQLTEVGACRRGARLALRVLRVFRRRMARQRASMPGTLSGHMHPTLQACAFAYGARCK